MKKHLKTLLEILEIVAGTALFGLGFNLFLEPHGMNAGGISGLSMVIVYLTKFATIGSITALINLPLFALGGMKIGKKFFVESLIGMFLSSAFIDLFSYLPVVEVEPLISALYGGVLCGAGLGVVYLSGGSTGGSDILVRLLKMKYPNMSLGVINTAFDLVVVTMTGLVFGDFKLILYSGISIFVMGKVIDAVIYRFDYSKVALIVSKESRQIAQRIGTDLNRGATFLHGQGAYSGQETDVILTAVKRQQVSDLKELVVSVDPDAFIIMQEAHQVLGDGFTKYSKYSL